jgi:hypothetical protein
MEQNAVGRQPSYSSQIGIATRWPAEDNSNVRPMDSLDFSVVNLPEQPSLGGSSFDSSFSVSQSKDAIFTASEMSKDGGDSPWRRMVSIKLKKKSSRMTSNDSIQSSLKGQDTRPLPQRKLQVKQTAGNIRHPAVSSTLYHGDSLAVIPQKFHQYTSNISIVVNSHDDDDGGDDDNDDLGPKPPSQDLNRNSSYLNPNRRGQRDRAMSIVSYAMADSTSDVNSMHAEVNSVQNVSMSFDSMEAQDNRPFEVPRKTPSVKMARGSTFGRQSPLRYQYSTDSPDSFSSLQRSQRSQRSQSISASSERSSSTDDDGNWTSPNGAPSTAGYAYAPTPTTALPAAQSQTDKASFKPIQPPPFSNKTEEPMPPTTTKGQWFKSFYKKPKAKGSTFSVDQGGNNDLNDPSFDYSGINPLSAFSVKWDFFMSCKCLATTTTTAKSGSVS